MINTQIRIVVTSMTWERNRMWRSMDRCNNIGNVPVLGWVVDSQAYIYHVFSYIFYNFICSSMFHILFCMYQILYKTFSFT